MEKRAVCPFPDFIIPYSSDITRLDCVAILFTGTNTDHFFHVAYEYLAIANLAGAGRLGDDLQATFQLIVVNHDLNSNFW